MIAAIEARGLSRRFGRQTAVEDLDLVAPEGCVYGFLGPNGAGKTTTIRMVLGLLRPHAGEVYVFGQNVRRQRLKTAAMIGSMVEEPALYLRLTGRENLEIQRRIIGAAKSEIDRVLEVVDLKAAAGRLAGTYSQGMRQRLGIARALLGNPPLLVLDEPTNGLDPDGIREMRELIRALPRDSGVTVFVSSHLLAEVEQMATHVGLMNKGRLRMQGAIEDLKARAAGVAQIGVRDAAKAAALITDHAVEVAGTDLLRAPVPAGVDPSIFIAGLNARLVGGGCTVFSLSVPRVSLEDLYVQATEGEA